jgi:hypothetical protein
VAVYLDAFGSVNEHIPEIVSVLSGLETESTSIFVVTDVQGNRHNQDLGLEQSSAVP